MNFIVPQTFSVDRYEEDTIKIYGGYVTNAPVFGMFYTSTFTKYDPYGEIGLGYGQYFPDPDEEFSIHWIKFNDLIYESTGDPYGPLIDNYIMECDTGYNDAGNPTGNSKCYSDDPEFEPVTDPFDLNACCKIQWRVKVCDSDFFGNPIGDTNQLKLRYCRDGECTPCSTPAGFMGVTVSDNELTSVTMFFNENAGAPWTGGFSTTPSIVSDQWNIPYPPNASTGEEVSGLAGFTNTEAPNGIYVGGGEPKTQKITLLENQQYRMDNSYCSHFQSCHHGDVNFSCPGNTDENYVNRYGIYSIIEEIIDGVATQRIEFNEQLSSPEYDTPTIFTSNEIESAPSNVYGNPCVRLSGRGVKYNGREFTWDTGDSCVSIGESIDDVGFDLSVPQGAEDPNFEIPENPPEHCSYVSPYTGIKPGSGLKILKSFPNPNFNDELWMDRTISVYYLSSDGRYMTTGGSVGVYELNRKDETLNLIGLERSATCFNGTAHSEASEEINIPQEEIDAGTSISWCIDNGYRYYLSGNTTITIDSTGFQSGVIEGYIQDAFVEYHDSTTGIDSTAHDIYGVGEIKSLPARFDSTTIWDGLYGGVNPATILINGDFQNDFMALIRNSNACIDNPNSPECSTENKGNSMVRTFIGQIGFDPSDNANAWLGEAYNYGNGQGLPEGMGLAWGYPSYKTFYGYGYDNSYADGSYNTQEEIWFSNNWKKKQAFHFRHMGYFGDSIAYEQPQDGSSIGYEDIEPNQSEIDIIYFHPSAPCVSLGDPTWEGDHGADDSYCTFGQYYGYVDVEWGDGINNVSIESRSNWSLDTTICDTDDPSNEIECSGPGMGVDGNEYPQCDVEGEVINKCFGCRDPQASNYCIPFGCEYGDFSCTYSVITMGLPHVAGTCDLNGDGVANIIDIVMMVNAMLGNLTLTQEQIQIGDFNGDGSINILDVVGCVNYIMSLGIMSNSDTRLLNNIKSVIQTPNGLRKARKLTVSAGYSTTMIKDEARKGANRLKNRVAQNKRLQNYESKSKRVKNNLTKAGAKLRKFKSRRRR